MSWFGEGVRPGRRDLAGKLNLLVTAAPAVGYAGFVAMGAYLRLSLGRWPVVYVDDPKTVSMLILDSVVGVATIVGYFGFPAWLLTIGMLLLQHRFRASAVRAAVFIVPIVLFAATLRYGPRSFSDWFID
jgi:hypothetical protein